MWLLKDPKGRITYLKPDKEFKIGRKQSDIPLENDTSISRTHSLIKVIVKSEARTNERASTCIVKDANSKYGTYIIRNGVQMKVPNSGLEMEPNDTLKIGLEQNAFKVEYIRIVTVVSRLTSEHKQQLQNIVNKMGWLLTDIFDDNCTHLTATTATSTTKIISALIAGIPVININFWLAVLKAIENNEELPNPNEFILPLQDKGINTQRVSLKPNLARKSLFKGKTFIFFSEKICKEYSKMIKNAGGKVELYTGSLENIPENLFADDCIVMQITDESLTNDLAAFNTLLYDKMQEKRLRMISETEIPLAIVYASLNQYCNPKYQFKELIRRKSLKKDESKILALDTQDIVMTTSNNELDIKTKQVLLPETSDFTEENFPRDEINDLNIINPNFNSEKNSTKEDKVQRKNTDRTLTSKMLNIDANAEKKKETSESMQIIESKGFDNSANNKPSSNFRLKRPSTTVLQSGESKKRVKEKVSDDDMFKNVQSVWKSKGHTSSLEISKKQSTLTKSKNDFDEIEKKKIEIKKKKEDELSKWGFKKVASKKSIDFDLDDFDEEELKVEVRQKTAKPLHGTNRKCEDTLEEMVEPKNSSESLESYQDNKILQAKSLNDNKPLKENMNKNWTAFKASKPTNKSDILRDNETCGLLSVQPTIKMEETANDAKIGSKTFKKVQSVIPIKRIALSDMTVWRPNS